MYLHLDTFEPARTPEESRSAWMLADLRAAARLQRLERRRARRRRLLALVTRREGEAATAPSCVSSAG